MAGHSGICGQLFCCTHTHTHVFRAFSHRGTGEEPGQSAFVLSSVYLVSVMSVKIYMIKKLGERGKKLISIES